MVDRAQVDRRCILFFLQYKRHRKTTFKSDHSFCTRCVLYSVQWNRICMGTQRGTWKDLFHSTLSATPWMTVLLKSYSIFKITYVFLSVKGISLSLPWKTSWKNVRQRNDLPQIGTFTLDFPLTLNLTKRVKQQTLSKKMAEMTKGGFNTFHKNRRQTSKQKVLVYKY